jgi:ribosomal protein S4
MSLHKIKPKLKKYKKAGLFKSKKDSTAQVRFFLPERTHLNLYLKKLENTYTNALVNRRKIKLLLGFSQIHKLNNFIKQAQKKRASKWRFSKSISLVSLIERRLDNILFRVGFSSKL